MNKLYVFMGYPGSGKSTVAKEFSVQQNALYLSSDEIREELFGWRDQSKHKETFEELEKRAVEHASLGNCVIDATNLSKKDRLRTIERYKKLYELQLICILRPLDEILEVNELRGIYSTKSEYIPDDILKRILGKFQLPTNDEGWKRIHYQIVTNKEKPEDCIFNLCDMEDIEQNNPHHNQTLKEHINMTYEYCKDNGLTWFLTDLALYHDLGKFYTGVFNEEKGYQQFIGHASVSSYIYLLNSMIKYLILADEKDPFKSTFLLEEFNNIEEILTTFYLIYYHDLIFSCETKDKLLKSLTKPGKGLKYWEKTMGLNIEMIVDLLLGWNPIDRMRPNE